MTWKWQKPDWPNFSWDHARLRKAEERFLVGSGMFACMDKHVGSPDQERLAIEAISTGAVTYLRNRGGDCGSRQRAIHNPQAIGFGW